MPRRRRQQATAVAAPAPNSCRFCQSATTEPQRNPTPITDSNGRVLVCPACRTKARKRELANTYRPKRMIRIDGTPPDPRIALGLHVEAQYTFDAIRTTLEAGSDLWQFLAILNQRLVRNENTTDHRRDAQQFRELFIQKLIAMPNDGELHVLVGRGQIVFGYASGAVERQVRQARPVEQASLDVVDAWSEPVNGVDVLHEVEAKLREFLYMQGAGEEFWGITLWTALTHCFQIFDFAPYLELKSAEKRCAKTRVMDVTAPMSGSSLVATNLKPETLFRALQKHHLVPFLDEAHLYVKRSEDHESVLNGGFQKGKPVWRCVGDNHDPQPFDIFSPKCLASIGDLQDTIEDRAVLIHMTRKPRGHHVRPWVHSERIERDELRPIRRKLKRWTLDHLETLRDAAPEIPAPLFANDRAVDAWRPLLAIADVAGGEWPERARQAAVALTEQAAASVPEAESTELLWNIRTIFYPGPGADDSPREPLEVLAAADLCNRLVTREEWLWATFRDGKPLSTNMLGKMLKRYRIKPMQKRRSPGNRQSPRVRGFWREDLDRVFDLYLPQPVADDADADTPTSDEGVSTSTTARNRETRETRGGGAPQVSETAGISGVAFVSRNGETRGGSRRSASRDTSSTNGHGRWTEVDPEVFFRNWAEHREQGA